MCSVPEIKEQFREYKGGGVSLRKERTTAFIKIDHAEKKNALSGTMMAELHDVVEQLESWTEGKSLVLYGSSGTFCSGGYLPTVKQILSPQQGYRMATLMHDAVLRLRKLPLVSCSLVLGRAVGGGAELALSTDFRLMGRSAQFKFVEAKMGVGTGWGGGTLLRNLVGRGKALELLLSCRSVGAEEAVKLGLVDGILEDHDDDTVMLNNADEWVDGLVGSHQAHIVRTVKRIVDCNDFQEEAKVFSEIWGGDVQKRMVEGNLKHK